MANPRKFSEKIALHTQKQAEETAAFEAILQEVTSATRLAQFSSQDPPRYQKQQQQQHIAPTLGTYRAGSLPNVNQISAKQGIDLQATLQQIDAMKQGKTTLVQTRHDRSRQQIGPLRRNFQPDKRIDSSPYGSAYHLSPPPDTSWRRVHSDPSLHMNAMGNASNNYTQQSMTPPSHQQIVEMVSDNGSDDLQMNYWESKKASPSRPKSCEVPNINIYPSQEHDCNNSPTLIISVNSNNTGSLPDLSVLQFPSPLATPVDQEDPYNNVNAGTPVSLSPLSPTSPHHMPLGHQSPQSPSQRRRQTSGMPIPSPLVLNQIGAATSPAEEAGIVPSIQQQYMCLQQLEQQQMRHRPALPLTSQSYPSPLYTSPQHSTNHHHHQHHETEDMRPSHMHQYTTSPMTTTSHSSITCSHPQLPDVTYTQQMSHHASQRQTNQQQQHTNQQQNHANLQQKQMNQQQDLINQQQNLMNQQHSLMNHQNLMSQQSNHISQQQSRVNQQQQPPMSPAVPSSAGDDHRPQVSMTQYRNSVSDSSCQSPTSPHSAPSYSPVQSPGVGPPNSHVASSTFSDAYYIQQQEQHSALQQQFEQFNMAALLAMSSSDDIFQPHFLGPIDVMASGQCNSQSTMSSGMNSHHLSQHNSASSPTSSKIPDIILTGADDIYRLPLDFARDLGNAITGLTDSFEADFLANDEAFKAGLDPLDFEEIQMLTDASLVADPAIEDSFKLDRL